MARKKKLNKETVSDEPKKFEGPSPMVEVGEARKNLQKAYSVSRDPQVNRILDRALGHLDNAIAGLIH